MGKRFLVAVYGTLKRGFDNYERHLSGETPVLSRTVRLPYRMYASREYPMLVPAAELHPVAVEVFSVLGAKLEELDALEGPYGYRRETVRLPGLRESVEIYVHPAPAPGSFTLLPEGHWPV